jgi:threonine dehydrogenase-like Zn-dependent dehydrogenase
VAAVGDGVAAFKEGDAVAVHGPWGCGRCNACQLSMENCCDVAPVACRLHQRMAPDATRSADPVPARVSVEQYRSPRGPG